MLIESAHDNLLIAHLVERLEIYGKVPKESAISNTEKFHKLSLV